MGTPSAIRQKAYRSRQQDGRIVLHVEIVEVDLVESLIAAGFLAPEHQDDRDALEAALERVVEVWTISVTRNDTGI